MTRRGLAPLLAVPVLVAAGALLGAGEGPAPPPAAPAPAPEARATLGRFVESFCVECHHADDPAGGLTLDGLADAPPGDHAETWEKVARRLAARQMPPADAIRPSARTYETILAALTAELDGAYAAGPAPGRTETFRRLTRAEYQNAVRDLLALEIDAAALLPNDESSRGFDNITVGDLSPALLERYIAAAQAIARRAVGGVGRSPDGDTFRLPADLTQDGHVAGLPLGTRGGAVIPYTFPREGLYEVQVRLTRDRNEHVEGLREPHELEILLDGERLQSFTIRPPRSDGDHQTADAHMKARLRVPAGPHRLGVTFVAQGSSLLETKREPYQAHYNVHRHPRQGPAVFQVSITGPYEPGGPGDTPSRRRLFTSTPAGPDDEDACARRILAPLLRRAYRRPVAEADFAKPLELFRQARAEGGFEAGIELALASVLVNPSFLFRIEADPPGVAPGAAYALPDVALASRLSFFLWGSLPDDALLDVAERGELGRPEVLSAQVRRMLADPRSSHLVTGFADQWLHLRNLASITPDLRLFPDFDDNLRQAFRRETELLFEEVLREDRSILDLLRPGHTYLNERLAKHYGIPHVYGDRFRRVDLGPDGDRGGLLRQGSILTVTSYATRTSPVIRGKWVLENLLGTPPPPPPANVPALKENTVDSSLSVRERLAEHRANPACAGCHTLMDPPGFALEAFDAVGRRRAAEEGRPIDDSGGLPDGSRFDGVAGLERAILKRPEVFATALTEKLLTFALGRLVTPADGPAVRGVVRDAREQDYRLSSLIVGIAQSPPFRMRTAR
jgi:mono/diheme cytochrome c family protein